MSYDVFKAKDTDDGAVRIDVVDVPEGISIQLYEIADRDNYLSIILDEPQIVALARWLASRPGRAPAPKILPTVAMLQLDSYEDGHFLAHAIGCALAIDLGNPTLAAESARECEHVNGPEATISAKLVDRLARLKEAAGWKASA